MFPNHLPCSPIFIHQQNISRWERLVDNADEMDLDTSMVGTKHISLCSFIFSLCSLILSFCSFEFCFWFFLYIILFCLFIDVSDQLGGEQTSQEGLQHVQLLRRVQV